MGPILTTFCVAFFLSLLWHWLVHSRKQKKARKNLQAKTKVEEYKNSLEDDELLRLISSHFDALKSNHDKTVYEDEYGTMKYEKWEKELSRFFKSVNFTSDRLTPTSIAKLTSKFIIEHSKELEEAK